jgi:uncharacterized protein YjbI with pentapeptide repeats
MSQQSASTRGAAGEKRRVRWGLWAAIAIGLLAVAVAQPKHARQLELQCRLGKRGFDEIRLPGADLAGANLSGTTLALADLTGFRKSVRPTVDEERPDSAAAGL